MSFDGFIAGPNVGVGNGMGDGGDRLHDWRFDAKTEADAAIVERSSLDRGGRVGEADVRRRLRAVGRPSPFGMPVFVVTHEEREPLPMQGGTTYTFVTRDRGRTRIGPCRRRRQERRHLGRREHHQAVSEGRVVGRDADSPHPHPTRRRHPALRGSRPEGSNCGRRVRSRHRAPPTSGSTW